MATPPTIPYSALCLEMLDQDRPYDLMPTRPHEPLRSRLQNASPRDLFTQADPIDNSAAKCCLAALWLWHDFLDESHQISQQIDTPEGSYWHAIMHRREGDFSNAKYWYRRVGKHAIFAPLSQSFAHLQNDDSTSSRLGNPLRDARPWDPYSFVDRCQTLASRSNTSQNAGDLAFCRQIGKQEWRLLFDYCACKALDIPSHTNR